MASGLTLPVGVNKRGGSSTLDGDEQAQKIIMMALDDNDSNNPFQQEVGLGLDMIFDLSDPAIRAKITRRLVSIFAVFESLKLYKLLPDTISWQEDSTNQELTLEVKYINLESDEVQSLQRTFRSGG